MICRALHFSFPFTACASLEEQGLYGFTLILPWGRGRQR
jgi:hypothetical protein